MADEETTPLQRPRRGRPPGTGPKKIQRGMSLPADLWDDLSVGAAVWKVDHPQGRLWEFHAEVVRAGLAHVIGDVDSLRDRIRGPKG